MNTQKLVEKLRDFNPVEMTWKFSLYGAYRTRDGLELEWNSCKMKGIAEWVDKLKSTLLTKTTVEKTVSEYSPLLPDKEYIGALERTDKLVNEQIVGMIKGIQNEVVYAPGDFMTNVAVRPVGYAFYGELKDDEGELKEQVLFIRRSNPFMSGDKNRLCTTEGDEIVKSANPILKFGLVTDFLLIGDICYFITSAVERDFELEGRNYAIAEKRMKLIAEAEMVSDYDRFEETVMKAKNVKKFLDFDKKILEHITRLSIEHRADFLVTYGVTLDRNGVMDTSDPDQCELIIDLLCSRSCLNPLGMLSVGSNIKPRE